MRFCARLAGLTTAVFALAAQLHAWDSMSDVFTRMDAAAAHFKGITADLEETIHTEIVDDNNVSTGTIKLRRAKPGDVRFLVEFTSPDPKSAAYSGNELDVYNPKTNEEQMYDVSTKKTVIEQAILLGFGATSAELKASYDVSFVATEKIDGQPTSHIKLLPKTKEMEAQVKQADLWISDSQGVPVQQKFLTSKSGNYNLFKFPHLKMAPGLRDDELQLKVPKNAQKKHVGAGSGKDK
jgi:outer membrane lipoprotein-sorting protein